MPTRDPIQPSEVAEAIEAERHHMALLLQQRVTDSLVLLLAQVNAYEQALGAHQQSRMALAIISTLVRQLLQQTRDLEDSLRPSALDALGLAPALDALSSQLWRAHGVQITLSASPQSERPPRLVELALFRLAQAALALAIHAAHARQIQIHLGGQGELLLTLIDDGAFERDLAPLHSARQLIAQMGGSVEIERSAHGGMRLEARMAAAAHQLTPRELEVLGLLSAGQTNKQIATALQISPRTVNFHLDNIYRKLGVASRTEALVVALQHGWWQLDG
jgi:DNA-binding CsgD family transcriptional regulator